MQQGSVSVPVSISRNVRLPMKIGKIVYCTHRANFKYYMVNKVSNRH